MNNSARANTINRGIRLAVIVAILALPALLTGLLTFTQPVRAINYVVININDSGEGSLRWAIDEANKTSVADIITFHQDTNGKPIILTGTSGEDGNATGDLDILDAGGDLIIQGNGEANTIIDGGKNDRVFHVCPYVHGGSCTNTATFTGVTIRNGKAVFGGGGIYNEFGSTTIVDSSTIISSTAGINGGGILNEGTLSVRNGSTIGATGAANTSNVNGGGIHNADGTTTVDASTVSANTAVNGGGIFNAGPLYVQNGSTIGGIGTGNTASIQGGGIYNSLDNMTVDASTVSANTASTSGGGIYNDAGTITVKGSNIRANITTGDGGGIYNDVGTITVKGSNIRANITTGDGGGIYNHGPLLVQQGSDISSNKAGVNGGGIFVIFGTTTVDASTISANTAASGGGIFISIATITVTNSTILKNVAVTEGGGIHNSEGTTTVTGSRILNNMAEEGGGVYNNEDSLDATKVTGSCIVGNSDNAFYNDKDATQIATGNWWGAAGGPNTPGADTFAVNGKVDVIPHLTSPILDCGPELQVSKSNDTGGNGVVGVTFKWTLTISSTGVISATFPAGKTILVDDLPAGAAYGAPVAGSFVDVDNQEEILCSLDDNTITCKAGSADVTLGANTGSFKVTIPVTPDAPATLTNPKAGGICEVDPDGNVPENDDSNNDCPENVVNVLGPELQVSKSNDTSGNSVIGTPFTWTLTISNTGPSSATFDDLQTILKDDLPAGPAYGDPETGSFVDVTNGDKILCSVATNTNTLTCKATGGKVTLGPLTGSFEVTLLVTPDVPATLVNPVKPDGICQVDPDGNVPENDEGNNDCPENTVTILDHPDLQIGKANDTDGKGEVTKPFDWTLTISNTGPSSATFAAGQTILVDDLPAGPAYGTPAVRKSVLVSNSDKIKCSLQDDTLTCKAVGADVSFSGVDSYLEVTFSVTSDAPATLTNPKAGGTCKVDPDGNVPENDENNNDCPENVVTILEYPDLQIGKANDTDGKGEVTKPFQWTLTISNTGPASATFAAGQIILKDDLPAGPAYSDPVSGRFANVTNSDKIKCSLAGDTLTCTADGEDVTFGRVDSYFDITFSITPDAEATLVNPDVDGICKVDPDGNVREGDESNNDCPENTVDVSVSANFLYLPVVMK